MEKVLIEFSKYKLRIRDIINRTHIISTSGWELPTYALYYAHDRGTVVYHWDI